MESAAATAVPATVLDSHLHLDPDSAEYKAIERRIVRKQDWRIMPLICLAYLLNYLDRTNLGNARTLNSDKPGESLVEALDLRGLRYNIVVAVFFIPYVLFEFPSNIALKYFTPSKWIARIMVSWGIVTICSAAVTNYVGLIAVRIALGIAEAGFFPGVIFYLTYWYKTDERATRMSIFAASVAVAGAFGGLIATGVSYMSGMAGLHGWQWLFILEGIPAVLCGILVYFALPDFPETAKFLTPEERAFAAHRMGPFAPKGTDKHFDKADAIACVKSWQFWAFAVTYFCYANSLNAFGYFAPTIISSLGFKGADAQLLTVPPNAFAFFIIIGNAWHSDRSKERPLHILAGSTLVMTGYLILAVVRHWGVRYMGVFFIACTNAAVIPFLALRTATVTGSTSTAIATGGVIAFSNSAGAVAPFLFPSSDSPTYLMGNWTCFALVGLAALVVCFLWFRLGSSSEYKNTFVGVAGEGAGEAEKDDGGVGPVKERDGWERADSFDDDGEWEAVTSKKPSRPSTPSSASLSASAPSRTIPGLPTAANGQPLTKKQRENAAKKSKEQAARDAKEQEQEERLRQYRREQEKAKLAADQAARVRARPKSQNFFGSEPQPAANKVVGGGMHASLNPASDSLIWD